MSRWPELTDTQFLLKMVQALTIGGSPTLLTVGDWARINHITKKVFKRKAKT